MAEKNTLARSRPILLGGAVVLVIAAAVGGYFLGAKRSPFLSSGGSAVTAAADRGVCQATLDRVRDFGITSSAAQLTSTEATATDTKDRVTCSAKDGDLTYTIAVNVKCNNMGDENCLELFRVTDSTGKTVFQHRDFLPPD